MLIRDADVACSIVNFESRSVENDASSSAR